MSLRYGWTGIIFTRGDQKDKNVSDLSDLGTPEPLTPSADAGSAHLQSLQAESVNFQAAADAARLTSVGRLLGAAILDWLLSIITLGVGWLIWAAITAGEAQTPAKKLMKMQVVDSRTGAPMTWGSYVFLRGLVGGAVQGIAGTVTLGILYLMPLWDGRNQSVAAKVSSSIVVDIP
jgi:uncharacterized RDD family membrane protein YckC